MTMTMTTLDWECTLAGLNNQQRQQMREPLSTLGMDLGTIIIVMTIIMTIMTIMTIVIIIIITIIIIIIPETEMRCLQSFEKASPVTSSECPAIVAIHSPVW